jgi:dTDP-4-dehydrorhamnose reductase
MKLLVTGGAGYLGSEIVRLAVGRGWDVVATWFEHAPLHGWPVHIDLRNDDETVRCLLMHRPEAVIHTAYRQNDDVVWDSVVKASRNIAVAASNTGSRLVHLSTDLVFDGEKEGRYTESDEPKPLSLYGHAKLAAEQAVSEIIRRSLIVRTSLLFGKPGRQEALALRQDVDFYTDEIRTPVRVEELAAALLELAQSDLDGTLHVAGRDAVSRFEFARLLAASQGRDPAEIRGRPGTRGSRARNVALDSSRAYTLLRTPIHGVSTAP